MRTLKVVLLGCGVVGSNVARYLAAHSADITARVGAPVELVGIGVRRADLVRPGVPAHLITTDADELVRQPDVDVVIEAIGGMDPARQLIRTALQRGASVISANKALIAAEGAALHTAAAAAGVDLYYEAAVGGAVPLIRSLRESLAGDRISRVLGIVNGTTNFILDMMESSGADYDEALKEATVLGYAEADPTADVEGHDAAAKAAILAGLVFNTRVDLGDVHREGITAITPADIAAAKAQQCVIKLLAVCDRSADGRSVAVRVHPAMIPVGHPLATVRGGNNAVFVTADAAGELMFHGPGAGGAPTASAVLGDLVAVCRNRLAGVTGPGDAPYAQLSVRPMADVVTRSHITLDVVDQPGAVGAVATTFGEHGVSIATLSHQRSEGGMSIVLSTHDAVESATSAAVAAVRDMEQVRAVTSVIRVEAS